MFPTLMSILMCLDWILQIVFLIKNQYFPLSPSFFKIALFGHFRRMNFLIFSVIQLITSNFHINFAIRGLARAHLGADVSKCDLPLGLIFDPRSKALVTNGRPGHLQFYCLRTDTQLFHVSL